MAGRIALAEISAMNAMTDDVDDARFAAVLARDAAPACGAFLYAVTTQGIYCRPGCPSPPPLRRHTRFFADAPVADLQIDNLPPAPAGSRISGVDVVIRLRRG